MIKTPISLQDLRRRIYWKAKKVGATLFRLEAGQFDDLVDQDRAVTRRVPLFNNLIDGIPFLPSDKKHPVGGPIREEGIIVIGPIESHDRAGLESEIMGNAAIMSFSFGNPGIGGHVVVMIEQYMDLHAAFSPAKPGPGKHVEAEGDSRRVETKELLINKCN